MPVTDHGESLGTAPAGEQGTNGLIDVTGIDNGKFVAPWADPDLFDLMRLSDVVFSAANDGN